VTAVPPDPDPVNTTNVERGGGVSPGETPPASGQTSASSNADPPARRKYSPGVIVALIAVALFAALFAVTAVLMLLKATNAIG
jgi:hypothetical protein